MVRNHIRQTMFDFGLLTLFLFWGYVHWYFFEKYKFLRFPFNNFSSSYYSAYDSRVMPLTGNWKKSICGFGAKWPEVLTKCFWSHYTSQVYAFFRFPSYVPVYYIWQLGHMYRTHTSINYTSFDILTFQFSNSSLDWKVKLCPPKAELRFSTGTIKLILLRINLWSFKYILVSINWEIYEMILKHFANIFLCWIFVIHCWPFWIFDQHENLRHFQHNLMIYHVQHEVS